MLPEGHCPSHNAGVAPPSLFLLPSALTHHPSQGSCPRAQPGIKGIYKSRLVQAPASCLITTCRRTMLGGLGKLAAEGLAHRTEKATEEAGKDPEAPFHVHRSCHWGIGTDSAGPVLIPAGLGQALTPWGTVADQPHRDRMEVGGYGS